MEARIRKRGQAGTEARLEEKRDMVKKAMIQLVTDMTAGKGMTTADQRAEEAEQTVRDCWIGPREAMCRNCCGKRAASENRSEAEKVTGNLEVEDGSKWRTAFSARSSAR